MAQKNNRGGRSNNRSNRQKRPGEKFDIAKGITEIRGDDFVTVFTVGINNQDHIPVQGRLFVVTCLEDLNRRISDSTGDEFITMTEVEADDRPELVGKYILEIARPIADVEGRTESYRFSIPGNGNELDVKIQKVKYEVRKPKKFEVDVLDLGITQTAAGDFEAGIRVTVYDSGALYEGEDVTLSRGGFKIETKTTNADGRAEFVFTLPSALAGKTVELHLDTEGQRTVKHNLAIPKFVEIVPTDFRGRISYEIGRARDRVKKRWTAMLWHSALTLSIAVMIWILSGSVGNQIIALFTGLALFARGRTKFYAFIALTMFVFSYMASDFFTFPIMWAAGVMIFAEMFYWLEELWRKPTVDEKGQAQDTPVINFYPWMVSALCVLWVGVCFVGLMEIFIPDLDTPPIHHNVLTAKELPMPKDILRAEELPMPGEKQGIPAWLRQQIINIIQAVTPTWLVEGYLKAQNRLNWLIAWLMSILLLNARALPGEAGNKMKSWWKGGTSEGAGKTIGAAFVAEWFTGLFRRKKK